MGLGLGELLLLAFLGILFLKPAELRRTAKMLGRWMAEMRRMSHEFTSELTREVDFSEIKKIKSDLEGAVRRELDGPDDERPANGAPKMRNPFVNGSPDHDLRIDSPEPLPESENTEPAAVTPDPKESAESMETADRGPKENPSETV